MSAPPRAPQPEECCMSGCFNCVWLQYAESLLQYQLSLQRNGHHSDEMSDVAFNEIRNKLEAIEDQNIRDFLLFELNMRLIRRSKSAAEKQSEPTDS
ncbi:unnamed protein product [Schistocephalus solidus]|uniref:Oxidoreductase-like domain-containing protein n=1 Tax=Schistocephalus solidus TaxID=70667 RepID=A0A183T7L6_SCHSO|nr:unnamed protein product [Schistocephalus solidus]